MSGSRDISIQSKLSLGFAFAFGLIIAVALLGLLQTRHVNRAAIELQGGWLLRVERLGEIKRSLAQYKSLATSQIQTTRYRYLVELANSAKVTKSAIDASLQAYAEVVVLPEERRLFSEFMASWLRYGQSLDAVHARLDAGVFASDLQSLAAASATAFEQADAKLDELLAFAKSEAQATVSAVDAAYRTALTLTAALIGIGALCVWGAVSWVRRHVSSPVLRVSEAMRRLTAGDLSVDVSGLHRQDEIGTLARAVEGYRDSLARGRVLAAQSEIERQRLDASEQRYRALVDATAAIVWRAAPDGSTIGTSGWEEVTGQAFEQHCGHGWLEAVHPDDRQRVWANWQDILASGVPKPIDYRIRHRDGDYRWFHGRAASLHNPDGSVREWVGALLDITERHSKAQELEAARKLAEEASQAKSEFLAAMSHEIRTPLNGILGHTDLLLHDEALSPRQRQHAERIQTAGSALLTVVNDILDFSSIEAGKVELDYQPFSAAALIDNAVSIVSTLAEQKKISLRAKLDSALPEWLVGDPDRLRQVLLNLLNNAIKFTTQGSITLAAERLDETGFGCRLRFSVSDTGIGIPRDKQDRLFRQFSQVDGSIRRQFGGTGLGLAISKRIVDLMGGEIGVNSELGQGSTFWFTVTLARAEPEREAAATSQPMNATVRAARILLVEDNEINQEIARSLLESAGHEVEIAGDGAVAVMAVQSKAFDLVLMDVQMPVMDGMTATQHIRALDHPARNLPIIAMTANVLPQQVQAFRAAGMNDHIGKPFKRDALFAVIAHWSGAASGVRSEPVG
jgi:PAS domain S-box-containing protein